MKKLYSLFATIVMSAVAFAQTTYLWDGSSVNPISGINANISSVAFAATQGNNNGTTTLITTSSVSSGYTGASGSSNFGAAAFKEALSTATSTYFSVTVTPVAGNKVTLNSLSFGSRGTSTGPGKITVYSSIDNYATAIGTANVNNNSTWALSNITFSGANLVGAESAPVTLRIYGSDSAGAGTPSLGTANWRIDDISLTVTSSTASLAVIDAKNEKSGNFVKNSLIKNNEIIFGSDVKDVKIFNMFGQLVKETAVKPNEAVSIAELAKGNYIVTGTVNHQPVSQKVLKD
ncbi:putative secreted protein (Por secretion system target) [Chryseobacterium sp. CBTAP 102]|uniref:T9SS type A sorting domain-containing protein n=1 Tax=unclassified Chryseobacterium TaxID=2593645 RepID=UPI000956FB3A|nr:MULTISPECIES: T9SS type A sorting domain-containing protein [unclassified Chryseobacterium]PXW11126.1 putative secreted protein (Por secretion system target) [Chryseobacterium sp. CBTAP 102]SIQ63793.1 Por secretion system C-terminal sorting domain-containing protein [Chryseobacterium sp. RU33C]